MSALLGAAPRPAARIAPVEDEVGDPLGMPRGEADRHGRPLRDAEQREAIEARGGDDGSRGRRPTCRGRARRARGRRARTRARRSGRACGPRPGRRASGATRGSPSRGPGGSTRSPRARAAVRGRGRHRPAARRRRRCRSGPAAPPGRLLRSRGRRVAHRSIEPPPAPPRTARRGDRPGVGSAEARASGRGRRGRQGGPMSSMRPVPAAVVAVLLLAALAAVPAGAQVQSAHPIPPTGPAPSTPGFVGHAATPRPLAGVRPPGRTRSWRANPKQQRPQRRVAVATPTRSSAGRSGAARRRSRPGSAAPASR